MTTATCSETIDMGDGITIDDGPSPRYAVRVDGKFFATSVNLRGAMELASVARFDIRHPGERTV